MMAFSDLLDNKSFGRTLRYNEQTQSTIRKTISQSADSKDEYDESEFEQTSKPQETSISSSRARRRSELTKTNISEKGEKEDSGRGIFRSSQKTRTSLVSLDDTNFIKDSPRSPLTRSTDSSPRSSKSPQGRLSPLSPDSSLSSPKLSFLKQSSKTKDASKSRSKTLSPQLSPKDLPKPSSTSFSSPPAERKFGVEAKEAKELKVDSSYNLKLSASKKATQDKDDFAWLSVLESNDRNEPKSSTTFAPKVDTFKSEREVDNKRKGNDHKNYC